MFRISECVEEKKKEGDEEEGKECHYDTQNLVNLIKEFISEGTEIGKGPGKKGGREGERMK
jgi:hypothetical protein